MSDWRLLIDSPTDGVANMARDEALLVGVGEGASPPTMSWPIPHCLMIEPTETESLRTLDRFADTMIKIAIEAKETPDVLKNAPHNAKVSRLDEVTAARKPNVRWTLEKEKREKRKEKK